MKICIVSHNAYGAITGNKMGHIGGVEWQTSLLARWLNARGHSVSFITWNEGGPAEENHDGIRLLTLCRQNEGLPGLRFFHPKWTRLVQALGKADADVYYHNCGDCSTGQTALWCRRNQRAFVFCLASDADCNPLLPEMNKAWEKYLYRMGVHRAGVVIAQTHRQQKKLSDHFGVDSTVIPMPCPSPEFVEKTDCSRAMNRVLWVGRVVRVKRPDRLLELAEKCPDITFDLVGPFSDDDYSRAIHSKAVTIPNLVVHGRVAKDKMAEIYQRASLLCCTSDYEGFPNTFLEAWSHGLPIVSTFDPDSLIQDRRLGVVVNDIQHMAEAVIKLLGQAEQYREASANGRRYYLENHTLEAVMPRFEQVFQAAVKAKLVERS